MIEIVSHDDAQAFVATSGPYLETRESENSLPLGIAYNLARDPVHYGNDQAYLLSILENGHPVGTAVMTPPRRIILSPIMGDRDSVITNLTAHLQEVHAPIPGVVGPSIEAQAFADKWKVESDVLAMKLRMQMRVFEVREVANVPLSTGVLRLATMEDYAITTAWVSSFAEAINEPIDIETAKKDVEKCITASQLYIWDDGGPVSIAKESRATRHGTTITAVYTPPERRNCGYATSCVHSLTKKLLSEGYSFCSLYTDLSNPTSNSIYAKIGYAPVGDSLAFDFEYP